MSEALLLQGIAGYTVDAGTPSPQQLFAAVLLGRPFDEPDLAIRACTRWAVAEASRAVGTGRVGVDKADLLAFRMVYRALRAEAAAVKPGVVPPKADAQWRRTLLALTFLRHRQRAALTLRYCLGLSEVDAGWVIGASNVPAILGPAVQRVVKALQGPADVPRALRTAGRKLCPPAPVEEVPKVARLPRRVVRDLVAPALTEPEPVARDVHRSPVEVLIGAHPKPEPCIPGAPSRPDSRSRMWSIVGRAASAAAVIALFVWAVWPAAN